MINLDNYESYLFLYQEGELDSSTCLEVERFLLEHPDIREEMETYYDPSLVVTAEPPIQQKQHKSQFWRWVAAACVVLALGWGVYLILPSQSEEGVTVAKVSTPEIQKPSQTIETNNTTIETTNTATPIETTNTVTVPATPSVTKPAAAQVPTAAKNTEKPILQDNPTTDPNLMAANQPKSMEKAKAIQQVAQPLPHPTLVESQQLAQVNEIIIVDNLAEEIPTERQTQQPSVLMQLARNIRKNLDGTKQDIQDFLYRLASSQSSEELADASMTNE